MHLSDWKSPRTIATLVLALCVVAPSNGRADAQASKSPSEIKTLASVAVKIGAAYSDVAGVVAVGVAFAEAMDLLKDPEAVNLQEKFDGLHHNLDLIYDYVAASDAAKDWIRRKDRQNDRFNRVFTAIQVAEQAMHSKMQLTLHSSAMTDSHQATNQATMKEEFLRFYRLPAPRASGPWVDGDRNEFEWRYSISEDFECCPPGGPRPCNEINVCFGTIGDRAFHI